MVEIDTLFQTKTTEKKNIPFGAAHTHIAYIRLWVSLLTQASVISSKFGYFSLDLRSARATIAFYTGKQLCTEISIPKSRSTLISSYHYSCWTYFLPLSCKNCKTYVHLRFVPFSQCWSKELKNPQNLYELFGACTFMVFPTTFLDIATSWPSAFV